MAVGALEAQRHNYSLHQIAAEASDVFFPRQIRLVDVRPDIHKVLQYDTGVVADDYWTRYPAMAPIDRQDISFQQLDLTMSHMPVDYPIFIAGPRQALERPLWVASQKRSMQTDGWSINFQLPGGISNAAWTVAHVGGDGQVVDLGLSPKPNYIEDAWGGLARIDSDVAERYAIFFVEMTGFKFDAHSEKDMPVAGIVVAPG